jgi:hypothetical protein
MAVLCTLLLLLSRTFRTASSSRGCFPCHISIALTEQFLVDTTPAAADRVDEDEEERRRNMRITFCVAGIRGDVLTDGADYHSCRPPQVDPQSATSLAVPSRAISNSLPFSPPSLPSLLILAPASLPPHAHVPASPLRFVLNPASVRCCDRHETLAGAGAGAAEAAASSPRLLLHPVCAVTVQLVPSLP